MELLRQAVIPVVSAYLVFLAILVAYRRQRREGRDGPRISEAHGPPAWRHLIRHVTAMAVGGYLFFVLIVVLFYFVLGNEPRGLIRQALVEGSLLTFGMVLPAFLLIAWIADRRSRAPRASPTGGPPGR
ncbi:MAG: DUF6256 family protein [Actinomycetota bacterium]